MELDTLIIADAVSTPPDGKFNILGGGISRCTVPELPFPIPLGVLARLRVENRDLKKDHQFMVQLIGPAGIPNVPPFEIVGSPQEEANDGLADGEERFVHFSVQIPAVAARAGLYHLEFHINGKLARSVPLPVVVGDGDERDPKNGKASKPKAKRPPPPPKKRPRR